RAYAAAQTGRLQAAWNPGTGSINRDIRAGLKTVRNRARDLWKNNDYVRGYRTRNHVNIIGPEGFTLQNKAMLSRDVEDEKANFLIEQAWEEWCKSEYCTMSGQLSFLRVQW